MSGEFRNLKKSFNSPVNLMKIIFHFKFIRIGLLLFLNVEHSRGFLIIHFINSETYTPFCEKTRSLRVGADVLNEESLAPVEVVSVCRDFVNLHSYESPHHCGLIISL